MPTRESRLKDPIRDFREAREKKIVADYRRVEKRGPAAVRAWKANLKRWGVDNVDDILERAGIEL